MEFPLNTLFTHKVEGNTITQTGRDEITRMLLRSECLRNPEWVGVLPADYDPYESGKARLPRIPPDWQWLWMVERSSTEYRGNFPTRYSAYVRKESNLKLPNSFKERLGTLARRHTDQDRVYQFDFVDRIDWSAGEFGDPNSCFWGGRAGAKAMIEENGGLAVRFFSIEKPRHARMKFYGDLYGYARAWVVPNFPQENMFIVWNGYGMGGDSTVQISQILASYFNDIGYREIVLRNAGNEHAVLYINNGRGILVGEQKAIGGVQNRIDLSWRQVVGRCAHCDIALYEGEGYTFNDEHYCAECYADRFTTCDFCGRSEEIDEVTSIIEPDNRGGQRDRQYCRHCYARRVITCDNCGNQVDQDNAVFLDGESVLICFVCRTETTVCPQCNCTHWTQHMHPSGDRMLCETCVPIEENLT